MWHKVKTHGKYHFFRKKPLPGEISDVFRSLCGRWVTWKRPIDRLRFISDGCKDCLKKAEESKRGIEGLKLSVL